MGCYLPDFRDLLVVSLWWVCFHARALWCKFLKSSRADKWEWGTKPSFSIPCGTFHNLANVVCFFKELYTAAWGFCHKTSLSPNYCKWCHITINTGLPLHSCLHFLSTNYHFQSLIDQETSYLKYGKHIQYSAEKFHDIWYSFSAKIQNLKVF